MSETNINSRSTYIKSMIILGLLFFIFGLVSWVNTILVPYFRITCELNAFQSYLVTFAFYIAYLVVSIPSSKMLNKLGYKKGMMVGLWIMSIGAFLFVPAAYTREFYLFLLGLFGLGVGVAILQSAANPYVTVIGDRESAASRMSVMGLFNKSAGILANLIFAALVIKESDKKIMSIIESGAYESVAHKEGLLDELILSVVAPYACLAVILFIFGLVIRYSVLPEIDTTAQNSGGANEEQKSSIFQYPYLILGVLAMFCHLGSQMVSLATIIDYAGTMGLSLDGPAKNLPSYIMCFTLVGYFFGVFGIPRVISQQKAFLVCTSTGLILSFLVLFVHVDVTILGMTTDSSLWFLVLMGLPNALIYAGIWPLAIRSLGKFTNLGSAMLVMGLSGSAIIPLIYGHFAESVGELQAYWILIPCFTYLVFYATVGHKINRWKR